MKQRNYGFIESVITDDVIKFEAPKSIELPEYYSYKDYLSPITNQGYYPYCIPHSVSTWLNWKENIKTGSKKDHHMRYRDIYNCKTTPGEGMSYLEAFNYLKINGVKGDDKIYKVGEAGFITNSDMIKPALLANGPCVGALPVYNGSITEFWDKRYQNTQVGYHSITIVGWNQKGLIIRNSWGTMYGDNGYSVLPYENLNLFLEIWTIFE